MEQIGIVEKISGENVEVKINRISGCGGGCSSCGGCDSPGHTLIVENSLKAQVGDVVKVKGEVKLMLKYTMLIYGIPLVTLLIGVFASTSILKSRGVANYEIWSFLAGMLTMGVGLFLVRLMDNKVSREGNDTVKMVEIL